MPNLGVVQYKDGLSFVMADIPGLIEGASEGAGLGHQFLRHVERCRVLIHLRGPLGAEGEGREPLHDFDVLNHELARYSPELAKQAAGGGRQQDGPARRAASGCRASRRPCARAACRCSPCPRATGEGMQALLDAVARGALGRRAPHARALRAARRARRPEYGAMLRWSRRAPRRSLPPRLRLRRRAGGRRAEHAPVPGA